MIRSTLVTAALLLAAADAHAGITQGVIKGKLTFFQNQGNFCSSSQDCTGARYPQSEFQTFQPVRNTIVVLRDLNGQFLGMTASNDDGDFTMTWLSLYGLTHGRLYVPHHHKDGRFRIHGPNGDVVSSWGNIIDLDTGATLDKPQNVGTRKWGKASKPNQRMNAYDGAERMWRKMLATSGRMINDFTDVDIRAFSNTVPQSCSTSCANGGSKRIQLDTGAPFQPQGRVMHEMGHVASYLSHPRANVPDYCYPNTGSSCFWQPASAEWQTPAFEEALATFFADTALWGPTSVLPRSCLSTGACSGKNTRIETSDGTLGGGSCASGERRWPLSSQRYLWDIYDSVDDGYGDNVSRARYEVIDAIAYFPNGNGDHQHEESYDWAGFVDDRDGHSSTDFRFNYRWEYPGNVQTQVLLDNNCDPL